MQKLLALEQLGMGSNLFIFAAYGKIKKVDC